VAAVSPLETFRRASDLAWRALAVGVVAFLVAALLWKVKLVTLPIFVALLLCSALVPLVAALEARGWPTLLATWLVFIAFIAAIAGALTYVIPRTASELSTTGDAIDDGLDDVEDWLVTGPLDLDRSDVEEYTDDPGGRIADWAQESSDTLTEGFVAVGEFLAGTLLALVLTFFFLKDGRRMQEWLLDHVPRRRRDVVREAADAAWSSLSGFLRGAALLGLLEGTVIGLTVWAVGAPLAMPVAVITFLAAFFPIVGAVVAGAVATLVTLATVGTKEALIVLVVVVVVQQLDGDLLAPIIYGRSLQLHPALVITVLAAGGALGGIVGAFIAVPLTAVVVSVSGVLWRRASDDGADPAVAEAPVGADPG
jgi:putative heme transporter